VFQLLPDARLARAGLGSARRGHADVWPVVRRHATAAAWCDRGGVQSGSASRTMSHPDMGIAGATTDTFILSRTVSGNGWCCLGCQCGGSHAVQARPARSPSRRAKLSD